MDHPVAHEIQRGRKLKSWIGNYLEKIVENEWHGRVHPHINPLGSDEKGRTGRMSITDPALSVLEKSALIRDCIVAGEGQKLLAIDYQNEELRIIASLCKSPAMIEAFERGEDMHKTTASKMFGIPVEEVNSEQKTRAKRAMFTKAYGGREKTFAAYMGLSFEEGKRYFDTLSFLYPELDEYIESQKQTISENKVDGYGHIFLSDGRKLNIPANISFKAVSYSSQGEGSLVLKKKLVQLDAAGFGPYLRLPVHDETIFEVPADEADVIAKEAAEIMTCYDYAVPLTVDITLMDKWGDEYREL
jgi:DNA polymerase-1